MNKQKLQDKLHEKYNPENWKEIIKLVFPNVSYLQTPQTTPANKKTISNIMVLFFYLYALFYINHTT